MSSKMESRISISGAFLIGIASGVPAALLWLPLVSLSFEAMKYSLVLIALEGR